MATLTQIRTGLANNLSGLVGVQVSPYMLSSPTPPTIHLYPGEIEYDLTMRRGFDRWEFVVQAFVGFTSDIGAQTMLDSFIAPSGSQSLKAALESDTTLGGIVDDVTVTSFGGYRQYAFEGRPPVVGAEWRVDVLATGI